MKKTVTTLATSLSVACSATPKAPASETTDVLMLAILWVDDPVRFDAYREQVGPVAARYGVIERSLVPREVFAEGFEKPTIVNLLRYHDEGAVEGLLRDPDYQAVVHLRDASTRLAFVSGTGAPGSSGAGRVEDRVYLVELARFGPEGRAAYDAYTRRSEAVMRRYGYHVEREIRVEACDGLPFAAELVKIAYFETAEAMAAFHDDPAHAALEAAYPNVVAQSLWMVAGVD